MTPKEVFFKIKQRKIPSLALYNDFSLRVNYKFKLQKLISAVAVEIHRSLDRLCFGSPMACTET